MAFNSNNMDWQIGLKHINERTKKILESGQWSDCSFVVGTDSRQETLQAHQLILAMASPVFEAMFYGPMASKEEKPIDILDVQPQAFKALLKYIYADEISFMSFDQVCEICYAAKKYMIPPLVEECTKYIWKDLHPGNVCRAFAFVRLFEDSQLLEKCMNMIRTLTEDVVRDQSFEDVDMITLKAILTQETLNVGEMDLWEGTLKWSKQECLRQSFDVTPVNQRKVMRELLPLFRFLTLSPTQFANGPALSSILTQEECFSLLMNISSPGVAPIPPNFSTSKVQRKPPPRPPPMWERQRYSLLMDESEEQFLCRCAGPLSDVFITDQLMDCVLSFSADSEVSIVGVILPTQLKPQGSPSPPSLGIREHSLEDSASRHIKGRPGRYTLDNKYPELIYAFLEDSDGCRLTYTHFTARVSWESTMEIQFNRPIHIHPNLTYKIIVVLNKSGRYPLYTALSRVLVNGVNFSFDKNPIRESVVKTLIFRQVISQPPEPIRVWDAPELCL